jgi:hypothetical protein
MWSFEHQARTSADPGEIWSLWRDVRNWHRWDPDVAFSEITGEFIAGANGTLKPSSGPRVRFRILAAAEPHSFTTRSYLPWTEMDFIHVLSRDPGGGTTVLHRVEMRGLLAPLFSRVVGRSLAKGLPVAMGRLIRLAESRAPRRAEA